MDTDNLYKVPCEIRVGDMILPGDNISMEKIKRVGEMKPREGDVLVTSYPRSGSTWMLEAINLVMNNVNLDAVSSKPHFLRAYYLEFQSIGKDDFVTLAEKMDSNENRLLKTHLPFPYVSNLVSSDLVKTIVVMRNPKDMLVSLFHFYQLNKVLGWFDKTWEDFFELFKHKRLVYGDWLDHVQGYWKNCEHKSNVLFVKYEDAQDDMKATLRRIAAFLNKDLNEDQLQIIATHVQFANMKMNPMANFQEVVKVGIFKDDSFIRKGTSGGWKTYLTVEQNEFVEKHYMKASEALGLKFKDH